MNQSTPIICPAPFPDANPEPVGSASLAELLQLLGHDVAESQHAWGDADQLTVGVRRVKEGASLIHMGSPATALYFVRTGTFKISRSDEDGYEQVLAFAGRGEVVAYDALCADAYPTAATALEDSTAYKVLKADLARYCRAVPTFEVELHHAASAALARTSELVDVMAAVSSEVRLARFLLQLSRKMAAAGQTPRRFILRMGRREMASLLGVAHETVSRAFSSLSMARLLHVNDRDVEILDLDALRAFSRFTRRPQEDDLLSPSGPLASSSRALPAMGRAAPWQKSTPIKAGGGPR